jgi:hypothetical protein
VVRDVRDPRTAPPKAVTSFGVMRDHKNQRQDRLHTQACSVHGIYFRRVDVLGVECGSIADGCGGLLDCGSCLPGQECGYDNHPNVCGAAAAPK